VGKYARRNVWGEAVELEAQDGVELDEAMIDRLADLSMLRLSIRGWTFRQIARYHGVSPAKVCRRLRAIPEDVRRRHDPYLATARDL
jgi:hypothetical protein